MEPLYNHRAIILSSDDQGEPTVPRQAAAAAGFSTSTTERLRPPPDLSGPEREVFLATVFAYNADHFRAGETPLLCAFCRAVVREKVASGELQASGYVVDGRPSPWASLLKDAVRDLTVTSRLLRLTPLARQTSPSSGLEPISAYERIALEHRDERN